MPPSSLDVKADDPPGGKLRAVRGVVKREPFVSLFRPTSHLNRTFSLDPIEKSRWVPTQLKTTLAAASQDYSQASLDLIQVTGPLPIGAQGREPSGARKGWRKRWRGVKPKPRSFPSLSQDSALLPPDNAQAGREPLRALLESSRGLPAPKALLNPRGSFPAACREFVIPAKAGIQRPRLDSVSSTE